MSDHVGGRAVVLGGSMAGMLAARVLADAYADVIVVDRDQLAGVSGPRRGVPQGHHVHGLLGRGQQVLEELLPGFTADVNEAGVRSGDLGNQLRWYFNGRRLRPVHTGLLVLGGDRPTIEYHVRRRVGALANVAFIEETDIVALVTTPDQRRVRGVRIHRRAEGSSEETLDADLIVDATGRGSRTPTWLEIFGYPRVREDTVKIELAYTTRRYRLSPDHFGKDISLNPVATPEHPRGAFLTTVGADRWALSLTGVLGDHPPTNPDDFLAYARSLPVPDVYEAIRDAEPLDDPVSFRFPASRRRRYERLSRLPEGLLVIGDAMCSFNPVYGQGMTVAGLQALILRRHLQDGIEPRPRRFFRDTSRAIDAPWEVAVGGDLAYPDVVGRRTLKARVGNAYLVRLQAAAAHDADVAEAFLRVAGLADPPQALLRPGIARRVLRGGRGTSAVPGRDATATEPTRPDRSGTP